VGQVDPDLVLLDVEMPEMNGLETLRLIRRDFPDVRVIMCSSLTERGGLVTLVALTLGADDYVTKASNQGSYEQSMERLRGELIPKIKQFFVLPANDHAGVSIGQIAPAVARGSAPSIARPAPRNMRPHVVVIGVSTGGPTALGAILPQFPANFPLPVLVVQHMPPLFTRLLADRLNAACNLPVKEACEGELVRGGQILIAPGDFHLRVSDGDGCVRVHLDQSAPQNSCRPSVDALFSSAGGTYGGGVVAAVLTGMGQDGLRGAEVLKAQGAMVLAQDEVSSVVWGMPGAVVHAGLADRVLPLKQIVPEILARSAC
jgi:two-component system chemotaxis response regulator CheB